MRHHAKFGIDQLLGGITGFLGVILKITTRLPRLGETEIKHSRERSQMLSSNNNLIRNISNNNK